MALDTQNRRMAALGASLLFRVVPPVPDNTIGPLDRLQLLALFRFGLEAGGGGGEGEGVVNPIGILLTTMNPIGVLFEDTLQPIGIIE
jgi:hypothetical protein